jgi:hypothetical protein
MEVCLLIRCLAIDVLLLSVGPCGNAFIESLSSNGSILHNILTMLLARSDKIIFIAGSNVELIALGETVKVTLRLTLSQPVRLGVEPHLELIEVLNSYQLFLLTEYRHV